jgi:hypothetical protein
MRLKENPNRSIKRLTNALGFLLAGRVERTTDQKLTWAGPNTDALPAALREKNGTGVPFSEEGLRQPGLLWAGVRGPSIEQPTGP